MADGRRPVAPVRPSPVTAAGPGSIPRPRTEVPEAVLPLTETEEPPRRRRRGSAWYRRRRRAMVRRGLLVAYVVAAAAVLQLLWAVLQMQQAEKQLDGARSALGAGDLPKVAAHVAAAQSHADRAGWGTVGPHLAIAGLLPFVGDDVAAVRELVDVTRTATGPLAADLLALQETLDPEAIRPVEGQIDVDRLVRAKEDVADAVPVLAELDERVAALDPDDLLGGLASRVSAVQTELDALHAVVAYGTRILDMAPQLLGADGKRSYLVVFQNNAELRATGGIPTAFAVLDADNGRLSMRDEGTSPRIRGARPDEPVLPETAEEAALFDGKLASFLGNTNLTPHWPRSAELIHEFWRSGTGESVDGVLSVDPVALSAVLRGTGPVQLADGKVATADDVVALLLHRSYRDYPDQASQNAFFEDSARRIFSALVEGRGDAGAALRGLHGALRDGRGYVWLDREDEQRRISGGMVAGELDHGDGRPVVGVYLNDSTATKLDYFVTSRTDVVRLSCGDDGSQELRVTTTLRSAVPQDVADWPDLLVGERWTSRAGDLLLTVLAYAPEGATLVDGTLDGSRGAMARLTHDGHPVAARTILLEPGQERELTWTLRTAPGEGEAPRLRTTPTARGAGIGQVVTTPC